jgi:putative pyruvate formate lyase activating enzyme
MARRELPSFLHGNGRFFVRRRDFRPAYLHAHEQGRLRDKVDEALSHLGPSCRVCPRLCQGVDRRANQFGVCRIGRHARVASAFPHFGEEDVLRGWNGSGTIFFGWCNLRCVFCQNSDISQQPAGEEVDARALARIMMRMQEIGCHNINFVTPEHVAPQVIEAVAVAADRGLALPIVYNTSAYDSLESIEFMDGIVDIYMPDLKYWSAERSRTYLKAENYPEAARAAIKAMHRQVGQLVVDREGLARRGLIIRHLVMPGALDETRAILQWIVEELGRDTYVNLMDQYYPAGKVSAEHHPEINRRLAPQEFAEARAIARQLGLRRLDLRRPHPRLARGLVGC